MGSKLELHDKSYLNLRSLGIFYGLATIKNKQEC